MEGILGFQWSGDDESLCRTRGSINTIYNFVKQFLRVTYSFQHHQHSFYLDFVGFRHKDTYRQN